jgi:hypothetical protein
MRLSGLVRQCVPLTSKKYGALDDVGGLCLAVFELLETAVKLSPHNEEELPKRTFVLKLLLE